MCRNFNAIHLKKSQGFTLIETIIGIVVLGISLSILVAVFPTLIKQSADQLHQIRATELAQSMLNEIQHKAFDENSDKSGGLIRCGELAVTCTASAGLGADASESRATYDDVDDYDGLSFHASAGESIENSQGEALDSLYPGYSISVTVCNDSDYNGTCLRNDDNDDNIFTAKLITVTIYTPMDLTMNFPITFSTYRSNF